MAVENVQPLLDLARAAVEREVRFGSGRSAPLAELPALAPAGRGGVFVTLRTFGRLRGCIGTFAPERTLEQTVRDIAVSAVHDARFIQKPLRAEELDALGIEVSLLTPLVRTRDPLTVVVGRHGILIRRGKHSGCFLPQVATERAWSVQEYLSQCCQLKASLPPDAWRDPKTQVFVFETLVLTDPSPRERTSASES